MRMNRSKVSFFGCSTGAALLLLAGGLGGCGEAGSASATDAKPAAQTTEPVKPDPVVALEPGSADTKQMHGVDDAEPDSTKTEPGEPKTAGSEDLAQYDSMRRFGLAEAPARTDGSFRLATYNIENLFDDDDDPTLMGRNEDIDDTKPEHELRAAARAIHRLDADVLCLQEIESLEALTAFRDEYLADMGYEHIVSIDAGTDRGIEQSVLSRFPLTNAHNWPRRELGGVHPELYGDKKNWNAGKPLAFRRSPLSVEVTVPAGARANDAPYTLTLLVVHHKSGRHNGYWREAEAVGLVELIDAMQQDRPEANIIVLGDFNAQIGDESVKTYLDAGFHDLFAHGPTGAASTTHESGRRIDLVLASGSLAAEVVEGSAFVLGTPARPKGVNWREFPSFPGYAADHYPVGVDIVPIEQ